MNSIEQPDPHINQLPLKPLAMRHRRTASPRLFSVYRVDSSLTVMPVWSEVRRG